MNNCKCLLILENFKVSNHDCAQSCLEFTLGNALSTSSMNEKVTYVNKFRHILHSYWAYCFCLDNSWAYTEDVIIPGTNYTPDRIVHENNHTIIYDYTVTVNVDRSYAAKYAKYRDHCDIFILIPYIINSNTQAYIESLNLVYGINCQRFDLYINTVIKFSNIWLSGTDDFEIIKPNYWSPKFMTRNSTVRLILPDISKDILNKWSGELDTLSSDILYNIHTDRNNRKLLIKKSEVGRTGEDWRNLFTTDLNTFLYEVTYKKISETYNDDDLIYVPVNQTIIHQSLISNFQMYMSRSIVATDTEYLSSQQVFFKIQGDGDYLLTNCRNDPINMLKNKLIELKSIGCFHKKETFMLPVLSRTPTEQYHYHREVLFYTESLINEGNSDKQDLENEIMKVVNRNKRIVELREELCKTADGTIEMYNVYNDKTATTELGKELLELINENKEKKAIIAKLERKVYRRNTFKMTTEIEQEINRELSVHESELNLLNGTGDNYIESVVKNILDFLVMENKDLKNSRYGVPIADPCDEWWAKVNNWDVSLNCYIGELQNINIFPLAYDLSEMCRSIIAMSDYKVYSKKKIFYDIPKHKRWCLLVSSDSRGLGSGTSRPFSVITSTFDLSWYNYDTGRNEINKGYVRYHWRYVKVEQLYFYVNILDHICSTYSCMKIEKIIDSPKDDLFLKVILVMLDGRRKTEIFLHDMKYLIFNLMGVYTNFNELIEDKFVQPTNVVLAYFQLLLMNNASKFIDSVSTNYRSLTSTNSYNANWLIHPLSNGPCSLDKFAYYNYISYSSIKGIHTKTMEDNANLHAIVKNHIEFCKLNVNVTDYDSMRLATTSTDNINNMLYYDHQIVMAVSEYMLEVFRMQNKASLTYRWYNIDQLCLASIATSSGMRKQDDVMAGKLTGNGHMMILSHICDNWSRVNSSTLSGDYKKDKASLIQNDILLKNVQDIDDNLKCLFTFANKKQWGGSREIYIQTLEMKSIQYRLEKMLCEMCKSLENELIHIPSNTRPKYIYNYIKRESIGSRYYLTLDCKRWAPLCNMCKYVDLINSWSNYLPTSFVNLFNFYMQKYFQKKLIINSDQYNNLKRVYPEDSKYFLSFGENCYSLTMPESFMMGMFNYLSSFFHASVQKYFIDNILPIWAREYNVVLNMVMFAHSDDSGGWLEIKGAPDKKKEQEIVKKVFDSYQNLMKLTNHHLSTKKCVISEYYFEIISIIFVCTDIMPTIAKNVLTFTPAAEKSGPINDLLASSSAMFEMISNGSTLQAAYTKRQMLCHAIMRSCNIPDNLMTKTVPVRLGGFPTSHPIFLLLFGHFAEEAFWYSRDKKLVNQSLIVSGQGYNKRVTNYSNPDPKYYGILKKVHKFFERVDGDYLIDINDNFPVITCYQYMIKMKSICSSGNLNKIFGSVLDTPLNFLKRMNQRSQYYHVKDSEIKQCNLPAVWLATKENFDPCGVSDILNELFSLQLPPITSYISDTTRIKPVSIHVNDIDPVQWTKRNQLYKLWKKVNYKYYLSVSSFEINRLIQDIPLNLEVFSTINIDEGVEGQNYELNMKPIQSREVNSLESIINIFLNNENRLLSLNYDHQVVLKNKKDSLSTLIREIIINKVKKDDYSKLVVNGLTLTSWLVRNAACAKIEDLGLPILYRESNQKRIVGTYDWLGKTTLIISNKGKTAILSVKNSIVESVTTNMKNKELIDILKDRLPVSGYHFNFTLTYGQTRPRGFYLSPNGNYYYSERLQPDPMLKNIYICDNLPYLPSHVNWFYGSIIQRKVKYSFEIMSNNPDMNLVITKDNVRLLYNPLGRSRMLSLPSSFSVLNMSSWYTASRLYSAIYETNSKIKNGSIVKTPEMDTLHYYTLDDTGFTKNYMSNEVKMKEQTTSEQLFHAINHTLTVEQTARSLKIKYKSLTKIKETRLVSLNHCKHPYYLLAGHRNTDRECIVPQPGHLLYDFLKCIDTDIKVLHELLNQYISIMSTLLSASWYHCITWPLLMEVANTVALRNKDSVFEDADVNYILIKNALFIKEQLDVKDIRNLKRSWLINVRNVFYSVNPNLKSMKYDYIYMPDNMKSYGFRPHPEDLISFIEVQGTIEYLIEVKLDEAEEEGVEYEKEEITSMATQMYLNYCPRGSFNQEVDKNKNTYHKGIRIDDEQTGTAFLDKYAIVNAFGSVVPGESDKQTTLYRKLHKELLNNDKEFTAIDDYLLTLYQTKRLDSQQIKYLAELMNSNINEEDITDLNSIFSIFLRNRKEISTYNTILNTIKTTDPATNKFTVNNSLCTFSAAEHNRMMLAEIRAISSKIVDWWLNNSLVLTRDQVETWKILLTLSTPHTIPNEIVDLLWKVLNEFRIEQPSSLTAACNEELNRIYNANSVIVNVESDLQAPQVLLSEELYT